MSLPKIKEVHLEHCEDKCQKQKTTLSQYFSVLKNLIREKLILVS